MIIVYPDQIAGTINLRKLLGKGLVRFEIGIPVLGFRGHLRSDILPEQIVEKRPES